MLYNRSTKEQESGLAMHGLTDSRTALAFTSSVTLEKCPHLLEPQLPGVQMRTNTLGASRS